MEMTVPKDLVQLRIVGSSYLSEFMEPQSKASVFLLLLLFLVLFCLYSVVLNSAYSCLYTHE